MVTISTHNSCEWLLTVYRKTDTAPKWGQVAKNQTFEHLHHFGNGNDIATTAFFDTHGSGRADLLFVTKDNDARLTWNGIQRDTDALIFRGVAISGVVNSDIPEPFTVVPETPRLTSRPVLRDFGQCAQSGIQKLYSCVYLLGNGFCDEIEFSVHPLMVCSSNLETNVQRWRSLLLVSDMKLCSCKTSFVHQKSHYCNFYTLHASL